MRNTESSVPSHFTFESKQRNNMQQRSNHRVFFDGGIKARERERWLKVGQDVNARMTAGSRSSVHLN